jgi:hypothetical protein
MQHYKFKITLDAAEPGGYFTIKRKLIREMPGLGNELSVDYRASEKYMFFEITSERPEHDIVARLRKEIGDTVQSWRRKTYGIERVVEKKPVPSPVIKSNLEALSDTISQLSTQITNYERNEETLVSKLVELEDRNRDQDGTIRELFEKNQKLEARIVQYSKDEKKYKEHEILLKENQELKLGLVKLGKKVTKDIEQLMHETKSLNISIYDHMVEAMKNGNYTKSEILQYLQDKNIDTNEACVSTALSVGKLKKKLWIAESRGHYKLL